MYSKTSENAMLIWTISSVFINFFAVYAPLQRYANNNITCKLKFVIISTMVLDAHSKCKDSLLKSTVGDASASASYLHYKILSSVKYCRTIGSVIRLTITSSTRCWREIKFSWFCSRAHCIIIHYYNTHRHTLIPVYTILKPYTRTKLAYK